MKIKTFALGALETNCYIVNDRNNKAVIIDPGSEAETIISYLKTKSLELEAILLTHGHFDHIGALETVLGYKNVPVYISEKDKECLLDANKNLSIYVGNPFTVKCEPKFVKGGDIINCGELSFSVIETGGHTPGGVCYYANNDLFSGDTLFYRSVGRTDFPGGSSKDLVKNIQEKLYVLPNETTVYPGHGQPTTIGAEKLENYMVKI